jgi:ketosteroid isomerase-like protein
MTTTQQDLDLARVTEEYFAAWEARDLDRILALHTHDTRFQIHAGSDPTEGRERVRAAFAQIFEQWPNFAFESNRVILGDRHWVLDWTLLSSGGPAGDIRFDCLDVVTVADDGLVDRKDTYIDMAQLQAALGQS